MTYGFIDDPLQYINLITDNLSDRYLTGFPVLKELIQNTDDSKSTMLDFGLSQGIADSKHTLLKGPAIFLINDGAFNASDARGIRSFGLNSKAADQSSIGKFGLGMKSVFHFCEAFFFLANDGERDYAEILNPWTSSSELSEETFHNNWNEFDQADIQSIKKHLKAVLSSASLKSKKAPFILWVPLRSKRHLIKDNGEVGFPIIQEYPADDVRHLDFLHEESLPGELATLFTFLRYLETLRYWRQVSDGSFICQYDIEIDRKAERIQLVNEQENDKFDMDESHPLRGIVEMDRGAGLKSRHEFVGKEQLLWNSRLRTLRKDILWPESKVRSSKGKALTVPDKAIPHGAVIFSRCEGPAQLTSKWSVFLPLEDSYVDTVSLGSSSGKYSFYLFLHGYFFIDAGRQGIHGFDECGDFEFAEAITTTDSLKRHWNCELASSLVLQQILPELSRFSKALNLSNESSSMLSALIKKSILWRRYSHIIAKENIWVHEISQQGACWVLYRATQKTLPLNEPPKDDLGRPWTVFPALESIRQEKSIIFSLQDSANLSVANDQWSQSELISLFCSIDVLRIFKSKKLLSYLSGFVADVSPPELGSLNVQKVLCKLLREALHALGLAVLQENKTLINNLVDKLHSQHFTSISKNYDESLLKVISSVQTEILLFPDTFSVKHGAGELGLDDASNLLNVISNCLKTTSTEQREQDTFNLAREIINKVRQSDITKLLGRCESLRIWEAYDCQRQARVAVSLLDIKKADNRGVLFGFSQGTTDAQRLGLATKLQCVLPKERVLLVSTAKTAKYVTGLQVNACDSSQVLSCIGGVQKELADIDSRVDLIKAVANVSDLDQKEHILGLRYLLHGSADNAKDVDSSLWVKSRQQSTAWEKLWRLLVDAEGQGAWQIIDKALAGALVESTWEPLKINRIEPGSVIDALENQVDLLGKEVATNFFSYERYEILNEIQDKGLKELWCKLPWHETQEGEFVGIRENTYLEGSVELPKSLHTSTQVISKNNDIEQQSQWIKTLDETAAIEIALKQEEPHLYCMSIVEWLEKASLSDDLRRALEVEKWLVLKNDEPIAPESIIRIDGLEGAIQKLSAKAGYCYASDKDLHDDILEHKNFDTKVSPFFGDEPTDLLENLALLMNEAPGYSVGTISDSDDFKVLSKTLADCELAPAWGVVDTILNSERFSEDDCKNHLLSSLDGFPEQESFPKIFNWLQKTRQTQRVKTAYAFYLRQMISADHAEALLPKINLLAKDGKSWRKAAELCIDAPAVDDVSVLCDEQRLLLNDFLQFGSSEVVDRGNTTNICEITGYLRPLEGRVKLPLLGLLAALLRADESLVSSYLRPISVDTIFSKLQWDSHRFASDSKIARDEWDIEYALSTGFEIRCEIEENNSDSLMTSNLLGNEIYVPRKKEFDNLIVRKIRGSSRNHPDGRDGGGRGVVTATISLFDYRLGSREEYTALIKKTCEWLWEELYVQNSQSLHQLWDKLSESHQLDTEVTRSVILKHATFYLNTLGANKETELKSILTEIQNAETGLAEAEHNEEIEKQKEWKNKASEKQNALVNVLHQPDAVKYVLKKVQSKLKEYQYELDSILFELLQNADDAVIQLSRCESPPNHIDEQCKQFKVLLRENTLYVLHWGRPVNDRCNAEAQKEWPGYSRDLEKMLIISASDKPSDSQVTGRFGLGFKSVFLACDSPKILSSDLKVEIVAGFLPEVWKESEDAHNILQGHTDTDNSRYPGTLVALPLREGVEVDMLLKRFKQQQAMLCMTSNALRTISIEDEEYTWSPRKLGGNPKLEFGQIQGRYYLVYRDQVGVEEGWATVVFHVSSRGFELLDIGIPSFWVVAPTRETAGVGFILSAPFQIDAGRGKLAGEGEHDKKNNALAERLGNKLGYELAQLYQKDWEDLFPQLQLADDVSHVEWWTSFWKQFECYQWRNTDAPFHLAKAFSQNLLQKWISETGCIPNGRLGDQADIVSCSSIRYSLPKNWMKSGAVNELQRWPGFTKTYPANSMVSEWVMTLLKEISPEPIVAGLNLNHLLKLIDNEWCIPEIAEVLERFISVAYDEEKSKLSEQDKKQLNDSSLKFLSKSETYRSTNELLVVGREEKAANKEEQLRAAFAPDKYVLSSQYSDEAISFFIRCRKKMGGSEFLEEWFKVAPENKHQAALRYIIDGDKGSDISSKVCNQKTNKWFDNNNVDRLIAGWGKEDQDELRKRLQSTAEVQHGRNGGIALLPQLEPAKITTLEEIYIWWKAYGGKYQSDYLRRLYPDELQPNLHFSENGDYDRESWMLLLSLGLYQRLGRVGDFQTRDFLKYFKSQGWWGILCTNPDKERDAWIRLLYEYAESQQFDEKYSHWMSIFPNIFKIALFLDKYVNIFEGIQVRKAEDIPKLLISNADSTLQGSGLSAPSISRALGGKGFNLVVRELLRLGVIDNKAAHAYAYMPAPRVKKILEQCIGIKSDDLASSQHIYKALSKSLGDVGATFDGDFDIPFLVLAHDKKLLRDVTKIELADEDEFNENFL